MIYVFIEESYASNNRVNLILEGILSVTRKKRIAVEVCTDEEKLLLEQPRVVILLCASLRWATDTIERLNRHGIHPLLFGFQYLETMYQYSCINLAYTKSSYLLTKHLLTTNPGPAAFLGNNLDSMPDRLKLTGVQFAANEAGEACTVFDNRGDMLACIRAFAARGERIRNIVCCNDSVAMLVRGLFPELLDSRRICSCSGLKLAEYVTDPHPNARINYFKAGVQLAELYFFLEKQDMICSTFMTLEMDVFFGAGGGDPTVTAGLPVSQQIVDFYGDPVVREVENLENMLTKCDEIDMAILGHLERSVPYEQIAETENLAVNTVKYRVHAMLKNAGASSKRGLIDLIGKYRLHF